MHLESQTKNYKEIKVNAVEKKQIFTTIKIYLYEKLSFKNKIIHDSEKSDTDHKIKGIIFFTLRNTKKTDLNYSVCVNCINTEFLKNIENKIYEKIISLPEDNYIITDLAYDYKISSKVDEDKYIIKDRGSLPFFENLNGEITIIE